MQKFEYSLLKILFIYLANKHTGFPEYLNSSESPNIELTFRKFEYFMMIFQKKQTCKFLGA